MFKYLPFQISVKDRFIAMSTSSSRSPLHRSCKRKQGTLFLLSYYFVITIIYTYMYTFIEEIFFSFFLPLNSHFHSR
ncbi:hypothetical protein EJB05_47500, partial [Eragrostis curvula]